MSPFEKDLLSAEKMIKKADRLLENMIDSASIVGMEALKKQVLEYEALSEKICNQARLLPSLTGFIGIEDDVEEQINRESEIFVEFTPENWFHVSLPSILPKKEKGSPTFIRSTLITGLKAFFKDRTYDKFNEPCVMVFKHIYSKERSYRRYRDHDNIEVNAVADVIALYVLEDDNPSMCSHFYYSAASDKDGTEIFVVPKSQFIAFLMAKGDD